MSKRCREFGFYRGRFPAAGFAEASRIQQPPAELAASLLDFVPKSWFVWHLTNHCLKNADNPETIRSPGFGDFRFLNQIISKTSLRSTVWFSPHTSCYVS